MNQIESCELSLTIKQLKLSVKFPCKLTFQHAGKSLTSEIASNATNAFSVNKDITIKEEKPKDFIDININLATEKGGNIMAGIIKINLKEINTNEGQIITLTLQKCLDPYASCSIYVKSIRMSKSRVKTMILMDDKKAKNIQDSRFQTKSEAPVMEMFKSRARYNEAEQFNSKKISFTSSPNYLKDKALSTAGFKVVKDASFQREELGSRFKHLNRKAEEEDNKTVITGKWRDTDQVLKSTMQANEKALKLEIMKYKTKYEQGQKNLQEKQKQIKNFKEQISDLNRQITEKNYLLEEIGSKNSQISKLEELNKSLSKECHEDRNRIIDLERELQQQKNAFANQLTKLKEQSQKRDYDFQKQLYQKKEEMKELSEESQYKVNQIKKMKVLIEDLERGLEMKGIEFEKIFANEKNQHNRTKAAAQSKVSELTSRIQARQKENEELRQAIKALEDQMQKKMNKMKHTQQSLKQSQENLQAEILKKERILQEKKIVQKSEEELISKLKQLQKESSLKDKQSSQAINQLNEINASNKKKLLESTEKNKAFAIRIQQLQNRCNILSASEDKLKRNIEILQKDNKNIQENQKVTLKNIKIKDDRILQLQRQLSDAQNKANMRENLSKKDLQYKTAQIDKQTARISDLQRLFEKQREENEARRLQILKNENKTKTLQQANHRLSQQITEIKQNNLKKEEELRSYIAELNQEIKVLEAKEIEYNKEIHNHEMDKINLKNEISRGEKSLENMQEKLDKSKKRQTELEQMLKNLSHELDERNQEIVDLQADFKTLENDYKLLQADKSKHEKITTIISEEKDNIKNDISKLKKEIEKRDQKEEQYLGQIKTLKEQITKVELRLSTVTKESQKFKSSISESIKSVMILKQNFLSQDSMSRSSVQLSRGLQRSRVLKSQSNDLVLGMQDNKLGDFIENFSKESHQTIASLNEQLRKLKKEKESLEKQTANLNNRLKETQDQLAKTIKDMSNQLESLVNRTNEDSEQYEQKISYLEKELAKKEKALGEMRNELQDMSNINQNQKSSHQINVSELISKIESLKFKILDLQRKDENNAQVFINLEEKITELEQYNLELTHQADLLSEQVQKKDRIINAKIEETEQLLDELQTTKRYKNDLSIELLSLKESLTVEKESNQRLLNEIKSQETKTTHLKNFQNQILKEKQAFLKKDFQKSQKVYALEEKVQALMVEIAQKHEQLTTKTKTINEQKESIKQLQIEINNLQAISTQLKLSLEKERERVKERDRKITEKDSEIDNLSAHIKKITLKFETQVKNLHEENEAITERLNKEKLDFATKSHQHQSQIKNLKQNERRITEYNTSLQQQIFFEKQTNSLNSSKIQDLKQQISDLQLESSRLTNEISMLNDQLKEKQESLFALSGKLYAHQNRLQSKEEEFKQRLEKAELDWRYKYQQICEEYQHKLEIIQREKNYLKHGTNDINQSIEKLQNAQISLKLEQQRQKEHWQLKIKRVEEQKLAALMEKNKQIEKLRELIEELEDKIKRKEFEYKLIEDQKKKSDEKCKELKVEVQKCEEKKNEALRSFQKEVDQFKRKEGQLKRFKQALKNSQWTTQRQIKKNIQAVAKTISSLSTQQSKGQILETMKTLESSVIKLALPNIDEL